MKTQVIQLDAHDDVISVCDKMSWTKSPRILLVFPHRARILARTLDLLRLKRHAAKLGAHLALVTRSTEIQAQCAGLGLPAFPTSASAQRADWGEVPPQFLPRQHSERPDLRQVGETLHSRPPRWQSAFAFRIVFFALGLLAVVAILLIFLPSASIKLTPLTVPQRLVLTIRASPDTNAVSVTGSIPAYTQTATVLGSQTIDASGTMIVPDGYALGSVRIENLTEAVVGIPAGTVVRTLTSPPVRFATLEDVVLPAGIGEWLDVTVQALESGPDGNLPAETITAIEGGLGASLSVINPLPVVGGTETGAPVATSEDRLSLQQSLLAGLADECAAELITFLPARAKYFPETVTAQALTKSFFPAENEPGGTLSLTMEVECSGQYSSIDDMAALALAALDANLPGGFSPLGEPAILGLGAADIVDGAAEWEMVCERTLVAQVDPSTTSLAVIGLDPDIAVSRLGEVLDLAVPPIITVTPDWWPRLPVIPFRISIQISAVSP